jgi:hypothetical protein
VAAPQMPARKQTLVTYRSWPTCASEAGGPSGVAVAGVLRYIQHTCPAEANGRAAGADAKRKALCTNRAPKMPGRPKASMIQLGRDPSLTDVYRHLKPPRNPGRFNLPGLRMAALKLDGPPRNC